MQRKKWTMAILVLALAGCNVGDAFKHPDTKVPEHFAEAGTPAKPAWPSADWWKQFHSPRLDELIAQAQAANFDLQAAVARVRQADAQARIAGAALLPSLVNATGSVSHDKAASSRSGAASGRRSRVSTSYNATLSAGYEIDFWGKNRAALESAEEFAKASRFDQETVALTVLSGVADTYFSVVSLRDRLEIGHADLAAAESLLADIRKRQGQGLATALDVAQQETLVETQRASLPPLELQLRQNKDALAILLGMMPESPDLTKEGDKNIAGIIAPEVGPGLPSELLMRRPDVQSAEASLASANADITVARAAFFPSIALTADAGYASALLGNLFKPGSMLYSLGASIAQPIFHGGALSGQLEFSKARYDELLADYRKAAVSAFSDTEDALASAARTGEQEKAEMNAGKAAHDAFLMSQRQFDGGLVDIMTVLNTQRSWFSAQDALIQAKLAHLQATVGLYKALGGGWEKK